MSQKQENKSIRLSKPTWARVANLGSLGRENTFEDVIRKALDIAEPEIRRQRQNKVAEAQ